MDKSSYISCNRHSPNDPRISLHAYWADLPSTTGFYLSSVSAPRKRLIGARWIEAADGEMGHDALERTPSEAITVRLLEINRGRKDGRKEQGG